MEILIKKGTNGESPTTNIKELSELLEIASIRSQIRKLIDLVNELKPTPKTTKKEVLEMTKGEYLTSGTSINLSQPGSIEKQKDIEIGMIYYNENLDKIRLNSKNGWININ